MKPITTAIFPVAGLGTRFLPVTKAGPKEMLPIVDKPVIQYVVEEAVAAGITHLVFVTSGGKRAIEDYFDSNYELEGRLKTRGNEEALSVVQNILPKQVRFSYVRQPHPLGLGDAVLSAKHVVGDAPFAVLLPDDIIDCGKENCLQQMMAIHEKTRANVVAVEEIPMNQTDRYGIVSVTTHENQKYITHLVEKPSPAKAPSNLAVTGRYILSSAIFACLEKVSRGVGGEIQLTDGIAMLLSQEKAIAYQFLGHRYDCGNPLGLLEATLAYAMKRADLRHGLQDCLEKLLEYT